MGLVVDNRHKWRAVKSFHRELSKEVRETIGVTNRWTTASIVEGRKRYVLYGDEALGDCGTVEEFFKNVSSGKQRPYYKSQAKPTKDNSTRVVTLVGNNFDRYAFDPNKDVFVLFTHPSKDCIQCKDFEKAWHKFAEQLKSYKSLVLAQIDMG